jgi:hypothetical protein
VIFGLSALLLICTSLLVACWISPKSAERFWIFVATICLQLGAIKALGSVFSELNRTFWITSQVLLFIVVVYFGRRLRQSSEASKSGSKPTAFAGALSSSGLALLICSVVLIALSGIAQIATPIHIGDEKMYHASRVIYWIQHQSAFPFESHNDRQTMFTFGSELFFLWPVLLTKSELVGRAIFWLGYPCAATGLYCLLRILKLSRSLALFGVLILVSTPLVSSSSVGLKPELWTVVVLLGTAYWAVAICIDSERIETKCFMLGVFTLLSINMRPLALALIPGIVAVPLCTRNAIRPLIRLRAVAAGGLSGLMLSALLIPFGFNLIRYHNIIGSEPLRKILAPPFSAAQLWTHAVRLPFLLLELPETEPASLRAGVSAWGNLAISAAGAAAPLPLEGDGPWPGKYSYELPQRASKFSLWGILWIPTMVVALWLLARDVRFTWPRVKLGPVSALTLLAAPLLAATAFGTRWMTASTAPDRFLIGPYALALPIGVALLGNYVYGRRFAEALAIIVVAFAVYQPLGVQASIAAHAVVSPMSPSEVDEPFHEALNSIPIGSCILFVGNQDAPDYPLFSPRAHYANRVLPWGQAPFEPQRALSLMQSQHVTHVLLQNDQRVVFFWDSGVNTVEMVAWLTHQPGIRELPLSTPHMRLFESEIRIH